MVSSTTLVATGTHHDNGRMTRSSSTSNRQITVYGAYGHTGRFVVDELRERGWTPVLAGRNPDRLAEVAERSPGSPVRVATPDDPDSLDRALAGSAAVALLVLATIKSAGMALFYLAIFGAGTVAGMMLLTLAMALPISAFSRRFENAGQLMARVTGLVSIAFGLFLAYRIGVSDGLLLGAPHWDPH